VHELPRAKRTATESDGIVKIGVLNDESGPYAAWRPVESAALMAVEDFGAADKGMRVEVVFADHRNKVDVAPGSQRSGKTPRGWT